MNRFQIPATVPTTPGSQSIGPNNMPPAPRPATRRELQLLANVFKGNKKHSTDNQRRLATWSKGQLEATIGHRKAA